MAYPLARGEHSRFTSVNFNVWLVILAAAAWGIVRHLQGNLPLQLSGVLILIGLGILSAGVRTALGYRNPNVIYSFTVPIVLYDLLIISVAIKLTGGYDSDLWLLFYPLLLSEAAVIPRRWVAPIAILACIGYVWAAYPVPVEERVNLGFRLSMLMIMTMFMYMVYRSHRERYQELAQLKEALQRGQERERIAKEFHDGLGHTLVSAIMGLELVKQRCETDTVKAKTVLQEQISSLREAMEEARQTIHHLHGDSSSDLCQRARRLMAQVQAQMGVETKIVCPDQLPGLLPAENLALARVVQESLSNILKHARNAKTVELEIETQDGRLTGAIRDDGAGFDPEQTLYGFGVCNLQERVAAMKGELTIRSAPGQGTEVQFWIPYPVHSKGGES